MEGIPMYEVVRKTKKGWKKVVGTECLYLLDAQYNAQMLSKHQSKRVYAVRKHCGKPLFPYYHKGIVLEIRRS